MTKTKLIDILEAYFIESGGPMSLTEYLKKGDAPVVPRVVKQACGSWSRALKYIEARKRRRTLLEPEKVVEAKI